MFGSLKRGWAMAGMCWSVLRRYPKLAVLPVISVSIMMLAAAAIFAAMMLDSGPVHDFYADLGKRVGPVGQTSDYLIAAAYALPAFAAFYVLTVIAVFCNVALIDCALQVLAGREPSIWTGLKSAAARLPQILAWALVVVIIGLLLEVVHGVLKNRFGWVGAIIGGLLGGAWAIASYLVLPVLIVERAGPFTALRRSNEIIRSKWGTILGGEGRIGVLGVLAFLSAAIPFSIGYLMIGSPGAIAPSLAPLWIMGLAIVYATAAFAVLYTLSTIFLAVIYTYATTGQVPGTFDLALVDGAFRRKA